MSKHLGRFLVVGTCLLSNSALAAIIDFDFRTWYVDSVPSAQFSAGGVTTNVTAWSLTTNNTYAQGSLKLSPLGLGVDNAGNDNSPLVDNGPPTTGWDDFVAFQFSQPVSVTRVSIYPFGDVDVSYNFDATTTSWISQQGDATSFPQWIVLNLTQMSQYFRFGAAQGQNDDSFTIAGLQLQTGARAVSEPGTLGLIGAGLIGLGLIRRRKLS